MMAVDPFTPGPSFDELADQATEGRLFAAPRDLEVHGVIVPAGTPVTAKVLREAGIQLVVEVR